MIRGERKVGPKGQVVIPKMFRESKKIEPGSKVVFRETENGILIEKTEEETEKVFKEVAEKGKSIDEVEPRQLPRPEGRGLSVSSTSNPDG